MYDQSDMDALRAALLRFEIDLPGLSFVKRDALSHIDAVQIHISDRTPVLQNPDSPGSSGVRDFCSGSYAWDVGGKSATDQNGRHSWKLSDYVCSTPPIDVIEPAVFVATPRSSRPVCVTSNTTSTNGDLHIEVFSWDMDGKPAPSVGFSWRLWAEKPDLID